MENVSDDAPRHAENLIKSCHRHGDFTAAHIAGGIYEPCPGCMAEREAEIAAQPKPVDEPKFDREAYWLSQAGVTKRFEAATFETYVPGDDRQRKVFEIVTGYATNFREHYKAGRSLVMTGRPGTGKTHLGFGILRHCHAASAKFTGKLVTVSELFRQIKSSWDKGSKATEEQMIKRFVEPHLLIIDEIGVQFDSQTEQNLLYEVINGRYQAVLPTVVISNLSRAELAEVVGSRSFDRLRENGGLGVMLDWESHRLQRPA